METNVQSRAGHKLEARANQPLRIRWDTEACSGSGSSVVYPLVQDYTGVTIQESELERNHSNAATINLPNVAVVGCYTNLCLRLNSGGHT